MNQNVFMPILVIIAFSFIPSAFSAPNDVNVPPTRALAKVYVGTNHVTAKNYLGQINITCNGLTCTLLNGTTAPSLTITSTGGGSGGLNTMQNVGGGQASVYAGNTSNTNFQFKTLTATGSSSLTNGSQLVTIYTHTYQNNTGTSLGTNGIDIYKGMSGSILQFVKLVSGNSNCIVSGNSTNDIITCSSANQTFAAPKVSINSFNSSSFTFGGGTGISVSNSSSVHTISNTGVTSIAVIGSGSVSPSTGAVTVTTKTYQNNTATNVGKGGKGVFSAMNGAVINLRNITSANTGHLTVGANVTDISLDIGFKINSKTCGANSFITTLSNSSDSTCATGNSGTVTLVSGTTNNITSTGGTTPIINLGSNVVVTGGSAQTISKQMTFSGNNFYTGNNDFHDGGSTTEKFDSNDIVIRNAAATFGYTLTAQAITANRTLNLPLTTGTDTLAALGVVQIWTANQDFGGSSSNTDKFSSSGIIIRNPASTFATTLTNAAISANRTLNLPLTIQTETIAVQPALNFTSPTNPTTTTSTTGVMSNLLATFTPKVTGRIQISTCLQMQSGTAGDGAKFDIRYGTTPLNEGAAIGNTVVGTTKGITSSTASQPQTACNIVQVTGLTVNQKIYIQIGKYAVVGGTATFANVNVSVMEI